MENNESLKKEPFESANVPHPFKTFDYETESLPLKGNSDYQSLISSLNMLTALRAQALEDINKVLEVQDKALADPLTFVKKLQNGEDIGIPNRLTIPEVPEFDWTKYSTQLDGLRYTRVKTREVKPEVKPPPPGPVIRGRVRDGSKSETFNKLWTPDEQFRLEELLVKYPPERNEARRFAKIAEELGNRTLKQVTSRCQKYFYKLAKKGMPVPGRVPRMKRETNRRPTLATSTFFPRTLPPVPVIEDGDLPGTSTVDITRVKMEQIDSEDSCDVSDGESRKLLLLRRVRSDLSRHNGQQVSHSGYTCNICKESPLRGTRWHCMVCMDVDFCSSCLINQLEGSGPMHPLDHPLASYRPAITCNGDKDYRTDPTQYNYLDGNFRPD